MRKNSLNNSSNVKKRKNKFINIALILIVMIIIIGTGYAKYTQSFEGEATMQVANMICEMQITKNEKPETGETVINPYLKVKVKNYNSENVVTETDVNYTIQVLSNDGKALPEYYWKDSEEVMLYENSDCKGSFSNKNREEKEYTIVFVNSGEGDITRNVTLKLVKVQAN